MTNYREKRPIVYVSGGGTASERPVADSTASPDSLATIIRDGVLLSNMLEIVNLQIDEPEGEYQPAPNKPL